MKIFAKTFLFLCGLVVATPQAFAESPHSFSANVSLTSDYKFYGFSQSNEGWAVQGGFDYAHASGFYLGTWASTIDFGNTGATDPAQIELDFYGGYANEYNGVSYDVGIWYYGYPEQNEDEGPGVGEYDYVEFYGNLGYTFGGTSFDPTIGVGLYWSPDYFGENGDSIYIPVSFDISLPQGFGAYVNYGYLDVDDIDLDYSHYKVGLTKSLAGFDFDIGWTDADDECGGDQFCEGPVFSISRSF